jgi:hypothetical protein
MGPESVCAIKSGLDSDGWKDAGLGELWGVEVGNIGDWLHIPGKGASLGRDLRGRESKSVEATKVRMVQKKVVR